MRTPPRSRGILKVRAERSFVIRDVILPAQTFFHTPTISGALLFAAAVVAMFWANSPWAQAYERLWSAPMTVDLALLTISQDLRHWVNDGLMTIFFFVIGLEIKREVLDGALSSPRRATLPAMAAVGGMVCPALIYLALNAGGQTAKGWGIPVATDIAFAVGVLALLGSRIPSEVRIFLLALAIVDDIGAILVIALFYSHTFSLPAFAAALGLLAVMLILKRWHLLRPPWLVLCGVLFWVAVLKSGIHATIAGVILGLIASSQPTFKPATFADSVEALLGRFRDALDRHEPERIADTFGQMEALSEGTEAPLDRLERRIHPWSAYLVMPLFALANAGVPISGSMLYEAVTSWMAWGIIVGLVLGKFAGVAGFAWLALRLNLAQLPAQITRRHLLGVGCLAGIGFTMSLFIAGIAFDDAALISIAKLAILVASLLSGVSGYCILRSDAGKASER